MKYTLKITATANNNNRTFTIRKYWNDLICMKYRTVRLSKEEFNSCENNTQNDWEHFLKSDDYYIVESYYHNY